jgi:hypothetical protein
MTDAATMVMEEQDGLSSGDRQITVSISWEKYNTHAPLGCIILLCETHMWKQPWRLTYTS